MTLFVNHLQDSSLPNVVERFLKKTKIHLLVSQSVMSISLLI